jgi:hypothetical protein
MRNLEQELIETYESYHKDKGYNLIRNVHHQHFGSKHTQSKSYRLINPNGDVVEVEGIVDFCRREKLHTSSIYKVLNGNHYQAFGWRNYASEEVGKKIIPRTYKQKNIKLIDPTGVVKEFDTISHLISTAKLCRSTIFKVLNEQHYQHKG